MLEPYDDDFEEEDIPDEEEDYPNKSQREFQQAKLDFEASGRTKYDSMLDEVRRSPSSNGMALPTPEETAWMTEEERFRHVYHNPFAHQMNLLAKEISHAPERPWDFGQEARRMNISYPYFRRVFEELFLEPPHHFLLQCRLQKAEAMLADNTLRIGEVALQCGFQDEFYFSRLFKKYHGASPLRYRKEHLPTA